MIPNRKPSDGRDGYYGRGASWAEDVHHSLRASRRTAWIVAGAALGVAALEAFAIAAMAPLKTVAPYVITVDRSSGYVEGVRSLRPGALPRDEALTHAALAQYVVARETFDLTDLQGNYSKVTLWSGGAARAQYLRLMRRENPESPLATLAPTTVIQVSIKSVSLLSRSTALVRFDTRRVEPQGARGPPQAWAAAIAFRYSDGPMRMEDRLVNPLGFQVTSYRRDPEAAPAVERPS